MPSADAPARPRAPGLQSALATDALVRFIQTQVEQADARGVVVGLSGGLDSAVTATLCARTLGPERVRALLLPSPRSSDVDLEDARTLAAGLGIETERVPLGAFLRTYGDASPGATTLREGNFTARLRMAVLYDRSARDGALVAGTGNKTEILLGYTTQWGDNAAAFSPLGDLYKTQVRILAEHLGVPEPVRRKPPSAGLWAGQTDEEELGAAYADLDALLYHYVDLRYSVDELVDAGFEASFVRRTIARVHAYEYKRRMPLVPKLSTRTVGHDFLYPRHWAGPEGPAGTA
jgi:NAD+ synthase